MARALPWRGERTVRGSLPRVLGVGLALLLAGCGGGGTTAPALPPCVKKEPAVELPREFPGSFPLPAGTVFTAKGTQASATYVLGVVPLSLDEAVVFFERELPAAGFPLGAGDSEPGEAETDFAGHGVKGRLVLNAIVDCAGAVTLTVAVARA
jgi:hypothetical protein